ncbi:hypothetical protein Pla22_28040 [Rubripirellula amarantea]|uniref:HNH endonuclease n=1 Tax=Rubripirellula amarantea TaxID=2527999 RepID=A0A5C5WX57_9BACT|nr:hypothetical protein [Rubripirellula amarantea]TWT55150.1 hypothetical protein Pla22_28040 [Rubripirellula amarantea]
MQYRDYIKSGAWKARKNRKLRNATWVRRRIVCRGCHCLVLFSVGDIHVHHLTYERLGNELDSDLAVLCSGCHAFVHGERPPFWWSEARRQGMLGAYSRKEAKALLAEFIANGMAAKEAAVMVAGVLCPRIGPTEQESYEYHKKRRQGGRGDALALTRPWD